MTQSNYTNRIIFKENIEAENPNKVEYMRELGALDISPLSEMVQGIPDSRWEGKESESRTNYNTLENSPLQHAKHIVFKFSKKDKEPFQYFTLPIWDEWKRMLVPIMRQACSAYNYEKIFFPRAMLALLPAGCKIAAHTDGHEMRSRPHKIHIPITTNEQTFFFHGPEKRYNFKVGQAYEVNNDKLHGVENLGDSNRIHFIFECIERKEKHIAMRVQTK